MNCDVCKQKPATVFLTQIVDGKLSVQTACERHHVRQEDMQEWLRCFHRSALIAFGERLRESSSLAFRVAYGVLRHREDAEDVAQEAFVRAHRSLAQLRDRERFRAWLVRMTWRLAIDRLRTDRRRAVREGLSSARLADQFIEGCKCS